MTTGRNNTNDDEEAHEKLEKKDLYGLGKDIQSVKEFRSRLSFVKIALVVSLLCNLVLVGFLLFEANAPASSTPVPSQTTGAHSARQLQQGTMDSGIEPAQVTVTVDGITYKGGNNGGQPTIRIEKGCGVYEHILPDKQEARVTCCGDGDCLLGFLTQQQWLLHWLRK
ncbi:expressed unknown protein [Seminavis robusta]|uniref:Uncharacterized protein n=1 Tax=Seminavis robusta TaxID=568900 RepID=A0A9N8HXQ4_9STRA|nr:expressed unknown protein [Seminavis robusta]CAB9530765.1 expressed unknown protein [Seminavis robusta]|eukprot:Sro2576_g331730.1 n/a (168) ;mRNA; r:945-1531